MGLVKARTRQEHVKLIAAAWQKGVESIIESGERIAAAKHELPHGEFAAMVEADLPFGPRTAQALMQISSHPVLSNAKYISHLPPAWGTLLKLAALPQTLLLAKIADGSITPKLGQNQVRALLSPPEQRDDDLPPDHEDSNAPLPEEGAAAPATNPLVVLWATTGPEERRAFVCACWDEIVRARDQADPAKPNGNAGADHWAHASKENAEALDRWIESDTL
jgi:hypothetical protein